MCRIAVLLLLLNLFAWPASAKEDADLFLMGEQAAKAENPDFAFMYYRKIVNQYPESKYHMDALFGKGEYYFQTKNYDEAQVTFSEFVETYPEAEARPFALMYLYKIASIGDDQEKIDYYQYEIISHKQVSFMFRSFQEFDYQSPLFLEHRVQHYIDKINFFVNGELLVEVVY